MQPNRLVHATLLLLFLASGCAALIYEVVWFQQLGLSLGASAISLAIVLTSFMGGMCLGSFAFSRLVSRDWHPFAVYAVLELLLAVCGLTILWGLPFIGQVYWAVSQEGSVDLILRAGVALLVLLPPTMLMGATLPAVSRAFESSPTGMAWLGRFYSANTLGAVLGCLASGLYLLRVYDVTVATSVAVSLNLLVALGALFIMRQLPYQLAATETHDGPRPSQSPNVVVAIVIALSGLTALGSEVVWTRLLALLFGPTVYTFSLILAVFLTGLAVGSATASMLVRRLRSPGLALAINQLLLTAAIPFAGFMIVGVLPFWWAENPDEQSQWSKMGRDVLRAFTALSPAACLWGASFPFGIAAASGARRDNSALVGHMYAANTLGAVIGALTVSLLAIPMGGTRLAMQGLTLLASCSGLLMLGWVILNYQRSNAGLALSRRLFRTQLAWAMLVLLVAGAPFVTGLVPVVPDALLAWGRRIEKWPTRDYIFVREGLDSAIVISDDPVGMRSFHVAGKVEASTTVSDMRTQRLIGHLPAMIHGRPLNVLVICCGSGMTAGATLCHPSVEKLTLCEIEHQVTVAARTYFSKQNYGALEDPRMRVVIDDGRHFLATTTEKFDIISTDPIHPWVRGAATLYTEEFYKLCKEHLNPGGVVTQWVPLYESSEAAVKSELATLIKVFPHVSLFSGQGQWNAYDVVAVGMLDESRLDPRLISRELYTTPEIRASLAEVGYGDAVAFDEAFLAFGSELTEWLSDAEINRDSNMRLQYVSGLEKSEFSAQRILTAIRSCRRMPESLSLSPLSGSAN